jgi:hypothetical protein
MCESYIYRLEDLAASEWIYTYRLLLQTLGIYVCIQSDDRLKNMNTISDGALVQTECH